MNAEVLRTLLRRFADTSKWASASAAAAPLGQAATIVVDVSGIAGRAAALWHCTEPAELYSTSAQVFRALANCGFKLVGVLEGGIAPELHAAVAATSVVPMSRAIGKDLVVEQALRDVGAECLVSARSAEELIAAYARENAVALFGVLSDNAALLLHNVGNIIFPDQLTVAHDGAVTVHLYNTDKALRSLRGVYGPAEVPSTHARSQLFALLSTSFLNEAMLAADALNGLLDLATLVLNRTRELSIVDFDTFKVFSASPAQADLFTSIATAVKARLEAAGHGAAAALTLSASTAPWIHPRLLARITTSAVPTELRQLAVAGLAISERTELAPHFFRACAKSMFADPTGRPLTWATLETKSFAVLTPEDAASSPAQGWFSPSGDIAGLKRSHDFQLAWPEIAVFEPKASASATREFFTSKVPDNIANKSDLVVFATVLSHALFEGESYSALVGRRAILGSEDAQVPELSRAFTTDVHDGFGTFNVKLNSVLGEKDWDEMDHKSILKTVRDSQGFAILNKIIESELEAPVTDPKKPEPRAFPNQVDIIKRVGEQVDAIRSNEAVSPRHIIYSTPTGSGKTFTALLLNHFVMTRSPGFTLVYSVPTKQVLKRVGTDIEANRFCYWTGGFSHEGSFSIRRPFSVRNKIRENPLKKAGILAALAYTRMVAKDAQDKNEGLPTFFLSDVKATGELLRAAALLEKFYADLSDDAAAEELAKELLRGLQSDVVDIDEKIVKKYSDKEDGAPSYGEGGDDAESKKKSKRVVDPKKEIGTFVERIRNASTREEAANELNLNSFRSSRLVLFYDEPNMGIHLNREIAETTKSIVARLPKTAILASATMPNWDALPSWWRGADPTTSHEIVSAAPYKLPINELQFLSLPEPADFGGESALPEDLVAFGDEADQEEEEEGMGMGMGMGMEEQQESSAAPEENDKAAKKAKKKAAAAAAQAAAAAAAAAAQVAATPAPTDDDNSGALTGFIRNVSALDVFPTYADFSKFNASGEKNQAVRLLRHFSEKHAGVLAGARQVPLEPYRRDVLEPKVKALTEAEFSERRNDWTDFKGTPLRNIRNVVSKTGITLVASADPRRAAAILSNIPMADWVKEQREMKKAITYAKRTQTRMDRDYERAISGKGKRRDGEEDKGDKREPEKEVFKTKIGNLKLTVEELEEASLEGLVLLSKGIAGSYPGVDPFVERIFQQTVQTLPDTANAVRPPIYILVVDFGSVYGTDCPCVDTVLAFEDLASQLSQDDLVQLLGRLRRDGRAIFRGFGTLSASVTADRTCDRWRLRFQQDVREFVREASAGAEVNVAAVKSAVVRFARRVYQGETNSVGRVIGEVLASIVLSPFADTAEEGHGKKITALLKKWEKTLTTLGALLVDNEQVLALEALGNALRKSPVVEKSESILSFILSTCELDAEYARAWLEKESKSSEESSPLDRFAGPAKAFVEAAEEEEEEEEDEEEED